MRQKEEGNPYSFSRFGKQFDVRPAMMNVYEVGEWGIPEINSIRAFDD